MAFDMSLVGKPTEDASFTYNWKDAALYALGIGAKRDELDYLYEGAGPKVYPSFAVVPKFPPMFELLGKSGGDLTLVVHGGEKVVIHKPFASAGVLRTRTTIRGIYDYRRFATALVDSETRNDSNELLCTTTSSIIFRGDGGFGGDLPPKERSGITIPKDVEPMFRVEEKTSPEQALLYRLSGDHNPLHADPQFAERAGFPQGPILHGLCTFGHMVRHVAKGACGGDASQIQSFEVQFRRPVWPGDTLITEGFIVAPGKIALQVKVKERDEVVISGAWAKLHD